MLTENTNPILAANCFGAPSISFGLNSIMSPRQIAARRGKKVGEIIGRRDREGVTSDE